MTDDAILTANVHISTAEIERDIADTEQEIANMKREEQGYRIMTHDRMAQFRADGRRSGILQRQAFIEKLQRLLKLRAKEKEQVA